MTLCHTADSRLRDSGSRCDVRWFDILGRGDFDEKWPTFPSSVFPRGIIGCFDHFAKISDGEKLPSGAALERGLENREPERECIKMFETYSAGGGSRDVGRWIFTQPDGQPDSLEEKFSPPGVQFN